MSTLLNHPLKRYFGFMIFLSVVLSGFTATQQHMNNFLIFRWSFFHLLDGVSLYLHDLPNHNDLFKYSPTFALLMAPFAALPVVLGAVAWNLCGALLFVAGWLQLPVSLRTQKTIFWVCLPEFIGSTQGFQSNIHVVGLLLLFFGALENKKALLAAVFIWLTFFIKIFGILGFGLILFSKFSFRDKGFFGRFVFFTIAVGLFLGVLPAFFVGWESLIFQYQQWALLLKNDSAMTYGFSAMGILHLLSGVHFSSLWIQIPAGILWLSAFFWAREGSQNTRLLGLVSLLYFLLVFNHKAESPTFIIAMVGFGLHLGMITNKRIWWGLLIFTLTMVSIFYSDLFPRDFKQSIADPLCFKIWPFLALYPICIWSLLKGAGSSSLDENPKGL